MKHVSMLAATSLAILGSAVAANASTITFDLFGGAYPLYSLPPGETLFTDFSSGLPAGATGNGNLYTVVVPPNAVPATGVPGGFVAPPWTATGPVTGQFFAVAYGQSETFELPYPVYDVSIYIGSLDLGNELTLTKLDGTTEVFTGADIVAATAPTPPGANTPGDGDPTILNAYSNGRLTFTDTTADIKSFTISEGGNTVGNSFEIAQIATSIPEASTWAMMGLGFAALSFVGYRSRRPARAIA